ncbi:hypothetical protein E0L36_06535 [Streptomyces sp. AJS327]|nr:hypothetical protein [Streptomyces sp. AJS327]
MEVPEPRADCTADRAGGLTFDVRLPTWRQSPLGPWDAALLLCRRGGTDPADTVRLPLTSTGAPGDPLRAALPSTVPLAEGRWKTYLALPGGEPERLLPGVNDLRSLVDRTPRENRTWLGVRIPYATARGNLSLRSWLRWPHAEVGDPRLAEFGMTFGGRLYGARLTPAAELVAEPRDGGGPPVREPVWTDPAEGGETAFTTRLRFARLAGHPVWDLWLRPGGGVDPVRLARILDDVPDKQLVVRYPAEPLAAGSPTTATPYYTRDNDLAVRVTDTASGI